MTSSLLFCHKSGCQNLASRSRGPRWSQQVPRRRVASSQETTMHVSTDSWVGGGLVALRDPCGKLTANWKMAIEIMDFP